MQKLIDDCYFFYYSTCSKNEACPYRHCGKALGNETVCKNWLAKSCHDLNCPYRHMMITKNRSTIPCYWESTPSGCQKAHCPFFHRLRPDLNIENQQQQLQDNAQFIIQQQQQQQQTTHRLVISDKNLDNESSLVTTTNMQQNVVSPLIVQMNRRDEESDSESTTNHDPAKTTTTTEIINVNSRRDLKNIINSNPSKAKLVTLKKTNVEMPELKLGVKTLEEIKKEKALIINKTNEIENIETVKLAATSMSKSLSDSSQTTTTESTASSSSTSDDRVEKRRLKFGDEQTRAKLAKPDEKVKRDVKQITLNKKQQSVDVTTEAAAIPTRDIKSLKIKTLEEIKAEKEMKKRLEEEQKQKIEPIIQQQQKVVEAVVANVTAVTADVVTMQQQTSQERARRLKIIKKPIEETSINDNKRKLDQVEEPKVIPVVAAPVQQQQQQVAKSVNVKTRLNINQNENSNSKKLKTNGSRPAVVSIQQQPMENIYAVSSNNTMENTVSSSVNTSKSSADEIVVSSSSSSSTQKKPNDKTDFDKEIDALISLCDDDEDIL